MTRYLLTKLETCERCAGDGFVRSPSWQQVLAHCEQGLSFNAAYRTVFGYLPADDPHPSPSEIKCQRCQGLGEIRSEVDLGEALQELSLAIATDD